MLLDANAFSDANNSAVVIFNVLNIFPYKLFSKGLLITSILTEIERNYNVWFAGSSRMSC